MLWLQQRHKRSKARAALEDAEKIGFARDSFFGVLVFPSLSPPFCSLAARFGAFVLLLRHYSLGPTPLELASPCVSNCRP